MDPATLSLDDCRIQLGWTLDQIVTVQVAVRALRGKPRLRAEHDRQVDRRSMLRARLRALHDRIQDLTCDDPS